ncbi:MAG: YceI family protein [bacterium]
MTVRALTAATLLLAFALAATNGSAAAAPASPAIGGPLRFVIVPGESQVIYRVGEVFINQGNRFNIAVGTTNAIRGEVQIDRANPKNSRIGPITVDISRFQSDSARRDNAIRDRWLESSRFPTAEFTPTAIEGLPETYTDGRELTLQVTGNLKIREVTRPTTFAVTLRLQGSAVTGAGTTTIRMTDFGFDPPSIFGLLRAENEAKLEFRFVARPGQ